MSALATLTVLSLLIVTIVLLLPSRSEGFKSRLWPRPCPCDEGISGKSAKIVYNPFIWPIISAERVGDIDQPQTLFSPDVPDHVVMTN